jgi:S-DNA-T family DNA segregation ATPase FtsK/SpoIIIE
VLQRLDAELRRRGEWFREVGAQDVAGYRQARPGARLPRILLVVDEFQEFFTEDDRIAQDAAQLLDRLVRQGRAFGLHVLLGSQTLGGAYSLARSTIDQMAVRVALQCSEADAQLILSADNAAARLLSRPGEAIYNDANGLVEGNSPFQVVWLGESRREEYLARIHDKARRAGGVNPPVAAPSLVVFEGNAPADVSRNRPLRQLLHGAAPDAADGRSSRQVYQAWLGEAMAIEDQTAARFRRQNGSNLLIVGQQEETALGMLTTALISLAAQLPVPEPAPGGPATFYVLDGSQPDAPDKGLLARLPDLLPQPVRLAGRRQAPALLAEVGAEVDRRQKAADAEAAPIFLVLFGLQRFRDLRRQEDDYNFLRKGDEAASPSQQLATLLREGATLGVHTLIWCDTLNNLQRAIDRQGMRELALRVALQMSVADSSNLIDRPEASRLGLYRALFASEDEGRLEKFRPYGLPAEEWLAEVKLQLAGRVNPVGSEA